MSKEQTYQKPPSLAQHFGGPDGYLGCFGWVCGYSADADFMNDAVERFTQSSQHRRASDGRAALALFLDPGNPELSFTNVPGVLHIPFKDIANKPFALLHAKVALLGFRQVSDASQWLLRLLVSTGNWTRQTMEESLDLAWCVDITNQDLADNPDASLQVCADFKAAAAMFDWLKPQFDTQLLDRTANLEGSVQGMFQEWLNKVTGKKKLPHPRFFCNTSQSLLHQLPALIKNTGNNSKRNYLAMGSGFFESATKDQTVPTVLAVIVARLKEEELLTSSICPEVFVNPNACQAIATCQDGLKENRFLIRPAQAPKKLYGENSNRTLHAKFLFAEKYRKNSEKCNDAWLYLGSGNLTGAGFTKQVNKGGNLEAGVVFAPKGLQWSNTGQDKATLVTDVLPIHWDGKTDTALNLQSGSDMEHRDATFLAAPVAWMNWCQDQTDTYLQAPEGKDQAFSVLDESGQPHPAHAQQRVAWKPPRPRQVRLQWQQKDGSNQNANVPVMDSQGRIAACELAALDLDQICWELARFPLPPEDDLAEGGDSEAGDADQSPPPQYSAGTATADYPIRRMMELVESIADKQTRLAVADWGIWCSRLHQCLLQASGSPALAAFKKININPLSPLWHDPFRPDFAQGNASAEGARYESVLREVEKAWGVSDMGKLGDRA